MKYIRTKDGVYKVENENDKGLIIVRGLTPNGNYVFEEWIIKQAVTIEELCDLFYLDRGGDIDINEFYDKYQFDVAKENYIEEIRHLTPVKLKAYINTDKSLLYVAKMNEKGELELV